MTKAIAKMLVFLNALSFVLFTLIIVGAFIYTHQQALTAVGQQYPYGTALVYGSYAVAFAVNVIVHGIIALLGACLLELERSRRMLDDIRRIWMSA